MQFRDMSEKDLEKILSKRQNIELVVDNNLIGLQGIANVDLSKPREIPPSQVILTEEGLAHLFIYSPRTEEGRWNVFIVCVYALGGKIFYSSLDQIRINANIKWN